MIREGLTEAIGSNAFPNWIGPQRFGSTRPVTPEVGRAVVEGDFERAVDLYVGMEATRESEESAIFRAAWRESSDPASCIEIAPRRLGYERAMLEHLLKNPDDHLGAGRCPELGQQGLHTTILHRIRDDSIWLFIRRIRWF